MIYKHEFRAMGCQMLAVLDNPSPRSQSRLAQVPEWFEAWEQCLSRFRSDSELSLLNQSAGIPVPVSQTLWDVLQVALEAEERSGGLVTPTVLHALVQAGYDRSFETLAQAQMGLADYETAPLASMGLIKLDPSSHSIRLPLDVGLDFGGVAKGWAAQRAMHRLRAYGPALVDAGGDIAISGLQADGQPWPVSIANPFDPDADLGLLMLGKCGVATSGRDYRRWHRNGAWQHHIIDPRSGKPAQTDVVSATVIAPTVMEAEVAAKVSLILGSQAGLSWLSDDLSLEAMLLLENGEQLCTPAFERYLWSQA